MTPEQFLQAEGINLFQTAIFTVIDGYVRQPDLCKLFEDYAKLKVQEYIKQNSNTH